MKQLLLLLMLMNLCLFTARAQEPHKVLSLERALEIAHNQNFEIRQGTVRAATARLEHRQAKSNLLPEINAFVNHGINQGRSIDPFTNGYIDQEIMYGRYSLEGSLLLFGGFGAQNQLKQAALGFEAAREELQQIEDNTTLSVILAYLQVLNQEELIEVAEKQVGVTREQLMRLERLHEQGAINPPLLAEMLGQLKAEELTLANSRLALESTKIALARLLNMPYEAQLQLVPLEETLLLESAAAADLEEVYAQARERLGLVKAAQLRRQSAEAGLRARRGAHLPSLYLIGNLNSNYSSVARINGERIYYDDQLRNNIFSTVGLSLRIPILNYLGAHNRVVLAKLELQEWSQREENTQLQLRQEVEQALLNLENARQRQQLLQEQEAAYAEAFRAAEIRFNAGVGTTVDYLLAKNNLDRSSLNRVMARNEFLLRRKILEYYSGL